MSLSDPYETLKRLEKRLARLLASGRCVDLDRVRGGEVIHTGFGGGPEFWLLDPGTNPAQAVPDLRRYVVPGGRLIVHNKKPIEDAERIEARGVHITLNIPDF